jgi:hypothetical protein
MIGLIVFALLATVVSAQSGVSRPVIGAEDHVASYWPTNFRPWVTWPNYMKIRYVNSGTYGLIFDTSTGSITRLGPLANPGGSAEAAAQLDNAVIEALPSSQVAYDVQLNGATHAATSFLGTGADPDIPGRLIDGGSFMQRVEIAEVGYATDPSLSGSVQLATMPRHLVLTHRTTVAAAQANGGTARIQLTGAAINALTQATFLDGDRALRLTDANGDGWVFLIPEIAGTDGSIAILSGGGITASRTAASLVAGETLAVSLLALPAADLSDAQLEAYLHPGTNVQVQYAQRDRAGSDVEPLAYASFDPERGAYFVDLDLLTNVGAPIYPTWSDPLHQTWYNRHHLVLSSTANEPVSIPLVFHLENDVISSITGGCAMILDENGEPLGVPVQISKNWHETTTPRRWYHFYATPLLPDGGVHDLEFTIAKAKWGQTFVASHAQLSLIGWNKNQQWDESALGCWGESVTYDPDLTLQRAMVDDVRPFLVQSQSQYNWTGNVGGADFLTFRAPNGYRDRIGRARTLYSSPGPNLTDVSYAGITYDGKIEARIRTRLGRTDDVVRVFYDLEYVFHDAVTYDRLAFFQVCADNYSDNDFANIAYGNAQSVVVDIPSNPMGTLGYATNSDRGIPLTGDAPWVLLYDNQKQVALREDVACVGFVIRDYEMVSNGVTTTTPHINVIHTNNSNHPEVGFELAIPFNPASPVVPAGTTLKATVEYLVLPDDKALYYGPSADMLALPSSVYGTAEMMRVMAGANQTDVQATVGTLVRTHPIEIQVDAASPVAAQFSLTGGFGYVPLVFRGIPQHDGWILEQKDGASWDRIGQEVEGNDYWQARFDPVSASYDLTFNIESAGTTEYRLIRGGPVATVHTFGVGCPAGAPLSLTANMPIVGGNWDVTVVQTPAPSICVHWFGSQAYSPGIDLGVIGAPGCFGYTNGSLGAYPSGFVAGSSVFSISIPFASNLLGFQLTVQASAPSSLMPVGFVTSNGATATLGI